ncbi:MAG: YihY/virulence factor BrkB family protein [Desulfobacula sp.]|jgi:membrane protein|uniref:YihY/virulence factor BrkB family protein n=1 Tax=Desulfobacula sp. TaxID=2593537 RepID=UPI001DACE6AE|nr:YihY/virulence factor BrkB family protein [Desulfobacula sp.]MBT3484127.1 YihY/virulence factor BrkB family protein [Desulfobacula sp.]MBT3803760.1 YihY/virulence factor BrkB family protein [Desulfobacula sp.]MBT4024465.1 YihY/virulence factor BrkB family protein [Desulfobacula sp.]MBT4198506.1 YihY/virulence factor BrkB family protein [Desulfobacula sp.]
MIDFKKILTLQANRFKKVIVFAVKEFRADRCDLRASSLTLFTLLSIVPVMAMAFGIAKGFGFKEILEERVLELFAGQEEVIQNVLSFSTTLLEKTKGGLMAVLGVILLFYSLIKLIGHIENAFNKIWWVRGDRQLIRKFTDYIAISITAGVLIIFSSSANIFITAYLAKFLSYINLPGNVENLVSLGFNIFPFLPIWILFIFFYLFIPNKKVDIKAALVGGIIAGTVFQVAQMAYLKFQVGVSSYNAIYGSFAALPLFLIWLQASWVIVLFGAEIAFSWENTEALETQNIEYSKISIRVRKLIVLRIVHLCVIRFANRKLPASDMDIANEIKIPLKIVKVLLLKLIECQILLEVNGPDVAGYVPARDIDDLSIFDVLISFEKRGDDIIKVGGTLEFQAFEESIDAFAKACKLSSGEKKLKDI